MQNYNPFIILILLFFSSELIAQNLKLTIIGSTDEETSLISDLNYNSQHIDYNSILTEANLLRDKIIRFGYIDLKRSTISKTNDTSFHVKFQLNNKYETIEINYDSTKINKNIINLTSKQVFNTYFVIPFEDIEKTLEHINIKVANNGFPFAKINLSDIKTKDNNTLIATLIIQNKENERRLDKIIIKGYDKFPKSYLKRYLKIKPEKIFNIETVKKKMVALNNLGFAEQTKDSEVLFTKDSTTLYMYLKKTQSNTFDGFLGFSTNEQTNKIDFNGYLNLELNNNLNYGETFKLLYKSDESEQRNFEARLNLPYLFSTPIGTEFSLRILKRDSSFTSVNQKANVFYQLNSKNRLFIGIENTESSNLLEDDINTDITDYKSNLYNLKYIFENSYSFNSLFGIKSKIQIELGFGKREITNSTENQEKITLDAFNSFYLNNKNSLYTKVTAALINSNTYFENELYTFGGINSIRGFAENSILANRYIVLNTEYRYQLSSNIYAHTILDFSNFENRISNIRENLYGFGLGFGIRTNAGLLKFNFANGKTEEQNFKFSNSKIHISLITVF